MQEADTDDHQGTLGFEEFCAFYKMMSTRRDLYLLMLTYSDHKDHLNATDLQRFLEVEQKVRAWAAGAKSQPMWLPGHLNQFSVAENPSVWKDGLQPAFRVPKPFHLVDLLWFPSWAMPAYFRGCPMEALRGLLCGPLSSSALTTDTPSFLKGACT